MSCFFVDTLFKAFIEDTGRIANESEMWGFVMNS